jgi:integrase
MRSLESVNKRDVLHQFQSGRAALMRSGVRREEAALSRVADIQERRGIRHLRIHGKGGKLLFATIEVARLGVHGLLATAATNAYEHEADLAKVQVWSSHANISSTQIEDRRQMRPEDSPIFRVK